MAAISQLDALGRTVGILDPKEVAKSEAFTIPNDADQKRLRALIERTHPEYSDTVEHWDFLEDTYEGGREWFDDHIFRYVKEGDREYEERKKRAYRFNHTREVVDLVNKYLFGQVIKRNVADAPDSLKAFWKNATKKNMSIDEFCRQASKMSSIFGRIGIVVDNNVPQEALTVAEAKKSGASVYAYIVTPKQMRDYSFDDRGDLNWILIEEAYRKDDNPFEEAPDVESRWRLWTKTEWVLFEEKAADGRSRKKKVVVVDKGTHNLGRVPVVLHDNITTDEEYCSSALIDEIAYLDRAVANYLSNLDAIIQDQTFSQLAMPAQGLMPGEDNYNKLLEMGTKRIFLFDAEGGGAPTYISPDVKQAQLIVQAIQKIINEIYHTVGLAGERTKEDNAVGIDNSSGVAKAYDFERVNALLAAKADSLSSTENKIAELVCAWNGEKYTEKLVDYPDNFDTRGLNDEFDIAAKLILVEAPDSIRREQMRAVVDKLFPMGSNKLLKQIDGELKKWPLDPIEQAAAMMSATAPPEPKQSDKLNQSDQPKAKGESRQGQVTKDTK